MTTSLMGAQPVGAFRAEHASQNKGADAAMELRAGQFWRGDGDNCWRAILCRTGVVWITQNGDLRDHVIAAGEMFLVSQPGTVIAQALVAARIEITPCLATAPFYGRFEDTIFA